MELAHAISELMERVSRLERIVRSQDDIIVYLQEEVRNLKDGQPTERG